MLKTFGLLLMLLIPAALFAQDPYSNSIFAPGADPDKITPMSLDGKFRTHLSRALSPQVFVTYLAVAAVDQGINSPKGWGQGWGAYGKRYATGLGRNFIRESIAFGMDGVLKTDPRVYRSRKTSFGGRLTDALVQTFVTRNDAGHQVPAVAAISSAFAAGQIATIWQPRGGDNFSRGLVAGATLLGSDAARNVFREFWPDIKHKFHH
jgi:hypothetical protein